jgi:thioredoxin reductase (NADPH)
MDAVRESDSIRDVVIVGGGPAGLAAGIFAAADGLSVALIEREPQVGGQAGASCRIENYPGFPVGITGREWADRTRQQAERLGVEFIQGEAIRLYGPRDDLPDPYSVGVRARDDRSVFLNARTAVIATGLAWAPLEVPGAESPLVHYRHTDVTLPPLPRVAVIGGGNAAGQAAIGLAERGADVWLISRSSLAKSMSAYLIDRIAQEPDIEVIEGVTIDAIKDDSLLGHRGRMRYEVVVDGVFVFTRSIPNTDWLDLERHFNGRILTSDLMTSAPGVFAIGDCRTGSLPRIVSAAADGAGVVKRIHDYFAKETPSCNTSPTRTRDGIYSPTGSPNTTRFPDSISNSCSGWPANNIPRSTR